MKNAAAVGLGVSLIGRRGAARTAGSPKPTYNFRFSYHQTLFICHNVNLLPSFPIDPSAVEEGV